MSVTVEVLNEVSDEVVDALNVLLPQLSSSASRLRREDVVHMIATPSTIILLARVDGRIIGTLTLVVFAIPSGQRAWIEDVVVDHSVRGVGAGRALTLAAIDHAATRGVRTIDLTSRPSRAAANAMYVKLGFTLRETNVYRFFLES